ncbi:MAG TPA: family 10 glycosylhydrolase [Candidatus Bathyarchaeia archaeon]|nr:family 10 glycosylhydrolase [Candidatus Bathyarchaeia archaeon]
MEVVMRRVFALTFVVAIVLTMGFAPQARASTSEFRALWVDAFGEGIFNEAEVTKLVNAAKAANINALVVQIGRRGDCFCNRASMPRTQANVVPRPYDPLDAIIAKAHEAGIQVHAWIITTALWNSSVAPLDPAHAFNQHGPSKTGYDNWLGVRYDGALRESPSSAANWFFDPGHPDAANYIAEMYLSVARNYAIDGLNFDRVRYPDLPLPAWPADNAWGYNPVALDRFQAATGRVDRPLPNDSQWSEWRRDQITNIVRKVYVEAHAIKPYLRISADTITYGDGPQGYGGDWTQTRPYRETLQDWRGWMQEGILDTNIPMNYKREYCTVTGPGCFGNQQAWYTDWNEFAKDNQYARSTTIGAAIYLNTVDGSVVQVRKALAPSAAGNSGIGWVGYSYRTPDCRTNSSCNPPLPYGFRSGDASRAELTRALTQPSEYDTVLPPVFATAATVPDMPWWSVPTRGHLAGTVTTNTGVALDQILVQVRDPETDAVIASRLTDGNGYFAFVDLLPGKYKAFVPDDARVNGKRVALATVVAGGVARVSITPFAKRAEGKRPPKDKTPTFVQAEDPNAAEELPNGER